MISFKNVTKAFGEKTILDDISFEIKEGETFCIIGPSGTGKSVTLRHMIGLLTPDSGEVIVDGEDIQKLSGQSRFDQLRKFGVLFQSSALLAWLSVEDNIALPLVENNNLSDAEITERVAEAIKMVHLEGAEKKKPSEISGGMQKRAGLARAIVTRPKILLYDEPTSGLDPVMSRHIDDLTKATQKKLGITSVVVTHDLISAFSIADRIAMLHDGKIGEIGTVEDFKKSNKDFVQKFMQAQFSYQDFIGDSK